MYAPSTGSEKTGSVVMKDMTKLHTKYHTGRMDNSSGGFGGMVCECGGRGKPFLIKN